MAEREQINMRFPKELIAKLEKLQNKFGVNRTDIIKLLVERITEAQLSLMLGAGAKQTDPLQASPPKPAVVPPVLSRSLPRTFNPAPKKQSK